MCVLASVLLHRTVVIPFLTRQTEGVVSLRKRMIAASVQLSHGHTHSRAFLRHGFLVDIAYSTVQHYLV